MVKLEVLSLAGCINPPHGPIASSRQLLKVPSGNRRRHKTGVGARPPFSRRVITRAGEAGSAARPLAATKWHKYSHSCNTNNGTKFLLKKQEFTLLQCSLSSSSVLNMITYTYILIPDDEKPQSNSGRTGITLLSTLGCLCDLVVERR